ncbi:hypothetical protein CHS0354_037410, partial [Potamilus streckersoni]
RDVFNAYTSPREPASIRAQLQEQSSGGTAKEHNLSTKLNSKEYKSNSSGIATEIHDSNSSISNDKKQ